MGQRAFLVVELTPSGPCSGFTMGRALWHEAALAPPADRTAVIAELIAPRLAALRD